MTENKEQCSNICEPCIDNSVSGRLCRIIEKLDSIEDKIDGKIRQSNQQISFYIYKDKKLVAISHTDVKDGIIIAMLPSLEPGEYEISDHIITEYCTGL